MAIHTHVHTHIHCKNMYWSRHWNHQENDSCTWKICYKAGSWRDQIQEVTWLSWKSYNILCSLYTQSVERDADGKNETGRPQKRWTFSWILQNVRHRKKKGTPNISHPLHKISQERIYCVQGATTKASGLMKSVWERGVRLESGNGQSQTETIWTPSSRVWLYPTNTRDQ